MISSPFQEQTALPAANNTIEILYIILLILLFKHMSTPPTTTNMKFLFVNAAIAAAIMSSKRIGVVADDRHVKQLDSTHLFPDADFRVDVDAATHSSDTSWFAGPLESGQENLADGRAYGTASVFPAFIRKMQQVTGKIVNLPEGSSSHGAQVQTLYLTESSPRHTDVRIKGMAPVDSQDSDESLVAFYVQKTTADAYFQIDDDKLCIPFVEGRAVYFNGGLPHNSIVKSGAVKLVGPFLLSSVEKVWDGGGTPPAPKSGKEPKQPKRE